MTATRRPAQLVQAAADGDRDALAQVASDTEATLMLMDELADRRIASAVSVGAVLASEAESWRARFRSGQPGCFTDTMGALNARCAAVSAATRPVAASGEDAEFDRLFPPGADAPPAADPQFGALFSDTVAASGGDGYERHHAALRAQESARARALHAPRGR